MTVTEWALANPVLILEILLGGGGGVYTLTLIYIKMWLRVHKLESDKAYHPLMNDETFRGKTREAMEGQYVTRKEHHDLVNKLTETNALVIRMGDQMSKLSEVVRDMGVESQRTNSYLHKIDKNLACLTVDWANAFAHRHGVTPSPSVLASMGVPVRDEVVP